MIALHPPLCRISKGLHLVLIKYISTFFFSLLCWASFLKICWQQWSCRFHFVFLVTHKKLCIERCKFDSFEWLGMTMGDNWNSSLCPILLLFVLMVEFSGKHILLLRQVHVNPVVWAYSTLLIEGFVAHSHKWFKIMAFDKLRNVHFVVQIMNCPISIN